MEREVTPHFTTKSNNERAKKNPKEGEENEKIHITTTHCVSDN